MSSTPSSGINSGKRSATQSTSSSDRSPTKRAKKDSTDSRRSAFHAVYEEIERRTISKKCLTDAEVQKISKYLDKVICLFEEIQPTIERVYTKLKDNFQSAVSTPIKKRSPPKPTVDYTNKSLQDLLDLFLSTGMALKCRYADITTRTVSDDVLKKLGSPVIDSYLDHLKNLKKRISKSSPTGSSSSASTLTESVDEYVTDILRSTGNLK